MISSSGDSNPVLSFVVYLLAAQSALSGLGARFNFDRFLQHSLVPPVAPSAVSSLARGLGMHIGALTFMAGATGAFLYHYADSREVMMNFKHYRITY
jgi:hypothetical protein